MISRLINLVHQNFLWAIDNYVQVMIIYIGGAILYACAKWVSKLYVLRSEVMSITPEEIQTAKKKYPTTAEDKLLQKLRESLAGAKFNTYDYPPLVSKNKGKLCEYAAFWPFYLVYDLIGNVTVEAFKLAYRKLAGFLQHLTNKILPK